MGRAASTTESSNRKVLVIDDDPVACSMIVNYLRRVGFDDSTTCTSGDQGWDRLREEQFALIVLDWKLPGLSGMALFNRIRSLPSYRAVPLLVVSGLLHRDDFRLLQEFPCTALLEKPFTFALCQNRVESLQAEESWIADNVAMLDQMLQLCDNDGRKAEQLLQKMMKRAPNPIPLALLGAKRLIKAKLLRSANNILEEALALDSSSVMVMNELGKVLHLRQRHEEALNVLRLAQKVSTGNIERLCLMGEIELNLKEPEHARALFERVLAIDPADARAQAGVILGQNMHEALSAPDPMQIPHSFASLLNTIGISFVRGGQFSRGIQQYEAALPFLTELADIGRVSFNLGLGFLRWGKADEALPWFEKAVAAAGVPRSSAYVKAIMKRDARELNEMPMVEKESRWARLRRQKKAPEGDEAKASEPTKADEGAKSDSTEVSVVHKSAPGDELIAKDDGEVTTATIV